jgi:hypothetical protein
MRISKLMRSASLLVIALSCCCGFKLKVNEVYPDISLKPEFKQTSLPTKDGVRSLLSEVWDSGFLNKNELNSEEILNNQYGIFSKDSELFSPAADRACYIRKKGREDKVMLNKKLFSHFERHSPGKHKFHHKDHRIDATLIHELFHDFWHNILDDKKRLLFSTESEIFYREMSLAQTSKDKLRFLRSIGFNKPTKDNFKPYEGLKDMRVKYSDQIFFGTELYAIIADRLFSGEMIVPKQLRKFYKGIISEAALNKGEY